MAGIAAARRRANRKYIFLVFVVTVILTVMTLIGGASLRAQHLENLAEQQELEALIAQEEERSADLEAYKEYTQTEEFAEWYAKVYLGLIHKNEIIFRGE